MVRIAWQSLRAGKYAGHDDVSQRVLSLEHTPVLLIAGLRAWPAVAQWVLTIVGLYTV